MSSVLANICPKTGFNPWKHSVQRQKYRCTECFLYIFNTGGTVGYKAHVLKFLRKQVFQRFCNHVLGIKMPRVEYGYPKALWIYENIVLNIRRYKCVAARYRSIKNISAAAARAEGDFFYAFSAVGKLNAAAEFFFDMPR